MKQGKEEEKSNVYKYLHWNFCVTECRSFLTYVLARVSFSLLFFFVYVVCVVNIREQKRALKGPAWLAHSLSHSSSSSSIEQEWSNKMPHLVGRKEMAFINQYLCIQHYDIDTQCREQRYTLCSNLLPVHLYK